MNLDSLKWENIAVSDGFRSADPRTQNKLRRAWLTEAAPALYPQISGNPQAQKGMSDFVYGFVLPPKLPWEDELITPESLNIDGLGHLEKNPNFGNLTRNEQNQLRQIWFHKTAISDPEFAKMDPDQKNALYQKLLKRPPMYASQGMQDRSGLFLPVEYTPELDVQWEDLIEPHNALVTNLVTSFSQGVGSLIVAPLKLLSGKDSSLSKFLADAKKERDWINDVSEHNKALTQTVPNIVGGMAGIILGPYGKLSKALAGGSKLVKGTDGVSKIARSAGLFQAVGPERIPDLVYQVMGGAIAGAIKGISDAVVRDEPWHTYLATDMTFGVGFEFLGRYFGTMRQIKKAAKESGVNIENVLKAPLKLGSGEMVSPELKSLLALDPDMKDILLFKDAVDKDGLLQKWMNTIDGVKAKAQILGLNMREKAGNLEIGPTDVRKKAVKAFSGPIENQIREANNYLDSLDGLWEKTLKGKSFYEQILTAPSLEMRRGSYVPTKGRKIVTEALDEYDINIAARKIDPRGDTSGIDEVYHILYSGGPVKAGNALSKRGILFSSDPKENKAIVAQIQSELFENRPKTPFVIVNKTTSKLVSPDDMPRRVLSNPDLKEPFYHSNVYTGNPRSIRELLNTLNTRSKGTATAVGSRAAKGVQVRKIGENDPIEMLVKTLGSDGKTHDVIVHFPTVKEAHKYLTKGKAQGLKHVADKLFDGFDDIRASYDTFEKTLRKLDPAKFNSESVPFLFTSRMAQEQGYHLAMYKGKYILQDTLDEVTKYTAYDSLDNVITHLKTVPSGALQFADLMRGVSPGVMDALDMPLRDPLQDIPYEEIKRNRIFGIGQAIKHKVLPTQYAVKSMEKLQVMKTLEKDFGFSPTRAYNKIMSATRAKSSFEQAKRTQLNNIKKGFNKKQAESIMTWMESLDDMAEDNIPGVVRRLKSDVQKEMVATFGAQKADEMLRAGAQMSQYFDEMFSMTGMSWSQYIKHYAPHYSAALHQQTAKMTTQLDPKSFTSIPKTEVTNFFELTRDVDVRDILLEKDVFKLGEIYTHLMSRKLFMEPTLKSVKGELTSVLNGMKNHSAAPDDYKAIVNYFGNIIGSIEGLSGPGEKAIQFGLARSTKHLLQNITDITGHKFEFSKSTIDPISKLISLTTGAHIAGRPYPVARNLTQSLITGGSLIGPENWLRGVDKVWQPGQLQRVMDLGVIDRIQIPTGAGHAMNTNSIIAKGMEAYKFADWVNRAIVYLGMEDRVTEAFKHYKMTGDKAKFFREAGANLFGKNEKNEVIRMLNKSRTLDEAIPLVRDRLSDLAVRRTQYLYERFNQPELFRDGIGRLFGQYTTWPVNFASFVTDSISSDSMNVIDKAMFVGSLGAITGGIAKGMYEAGLNPRSFLPWNMGMMDAGPYHQLLTDTLRAANGDQGAWNNVVNNVTMLAPFMNQAESSWKAVEALSEGELEEAFLLFASAPIRYDLYPKRETPVDEIRKKLIEAGSMYRGFKNEIPFE